MGTWGIITPDYETITIKSNSIADQHLLDATQTEIPCDLTGCQDVLSKQGRSRNLNIMPASKFMQARGCLTALRYYRGLWVKYCQNLRSSFMVLIPFLGILGTMEEQILFLGLWVLVWKNRWGSQPLEHLSWCNTLGNSLQRECNHPFHIL